MSADDIRRTINALESLDQQNEDMNPADIVGLASAGATGGMVAAPVIYAIKKFLDWWDWRNVKENQNTNDEAQQMFAYVKKHASEVADQPLPSDEVISKLVNIAVKLDQSGKSNDEIIQSLEKMTGNTNESTLDEAGPIHDWLPPDVLGAIDLIRTYAAGIGFGAIVTGILSTLVNALHGKYKK